MYNTMSFKIFYYPIVIKEHHLDTFNHVNNATYLELLEEARWEFLTQNGFGLNEIQRLKVGPIVLEFHIKFLKELTLRQAITIESQLLTYERKVGSMQQTIYDENHTRCCEAHMTFGFFDMIARKLIPPSNEWLSAIGAHDEKP